jgi:hypothetical protein
LKDTVASSETRQAIVKSVINSIPQWSEGVSASTKNIVPGGSTVIDLKIGQRDPEVEGSHWIVYDKKNNHATASLVCKRGSLNDFSEVIISTNDGSDRQVNITGQYALSTIRSIISDYFLNMGINIYEDSSFIRDELDAFNGITIGPTLSKKMYYPVDPFVSFAKTQIQGDIRSLRIELRATAEPGSIASHARVCTSSTTVALWTETNLEFNDIRYIRNYVIVSNPVLRNKFLSGIDPKIPIKHTQWKVEDKLLYTGVWDDTAHVNTKLSDIYKSRKIQAIYPYVVGIATAYNSTECEKEYSGYQNILWKHRELTNGNEKTVDMTDARRLREHEIRQYRHMYGKQHLPIELFGATENDFKKFFLRMSMINFDYLQEEAGHEVLRYVDSLNQDYELDFYGAQELNGGSNCELRCAVVYLEEFDYVKNGSNVGQVVKVA